jgi:hypothetical protein
MKQISTGLKLRTLLLTSVSSVVLLSGCETYQNIKYNFFNVRPAQQVDGERRQPMLNSRYAGYGAPEAPAPAAQPQALRAPAAQTAAPAAPTPYDQFDAQGNAQAPQMKPMAVAPQPQAAAQPVMPPAAKPAPQASEGNFFTRMFSSSDSTSEKPAVRKPFPGNPVHSKHTEATAPIPQGPLEPPVEGAVPLGDDAAGMKPMPESPEPTAPLLDKQVSGKPSSDMPWWQRPASTPASSEQKTAAVISPKQEPIAPAVEQVQETAKQSEQTAPVAEAKPLVMAEPEVVKQPEPKQPEAEQANAIPFDYEPQEPGEEITVSRLSDKKNKPQPNWFERNFGSSGKKSEPTKENSGVEFVRVAPDVQESKPASKGNELTTKPQEQQYATATSGQPTSTQPTSGRTWIERVLGFKDAPTPEQKAPYPNVASVPTMPDRFDAIKDAKPLAMEELEAERDQAVVNKMELNSEPSGQAVSPMAESQPTSPVAPTPIAPAPVTSTGSGAQLLGHVSDPPKMEKPDAKKPDSKQLNTQPAAEPFDAPAQKEVETEKKDEQEWPNKPSSSVDPVTETQTMATATVPEAPVQAAEKPKEEKSFLKSIAWPWQSKNTDSKPVEQKLAEPAAEPVKLQTDNVPDAPAGQQGLTALSWDDEPAAPLAVKDPVAPLVPHPVIQPATQKAAAPAEMVVPAQTPAPAWVATSAGGNPPAAAIAPPVPAFATSQPENSLPPLATEAPKAQAEAEEQKAEADAAVTSGAALPSPQLLQKVKPLPPSRYENRRKQAQ